MTSVISPQTIIGHGVVIGQFSVIHPGVEIGSGTVIGSFCEIGSVSAERTVVGPDSTIRSYTNIQGGSTFGEGLQTGQYTMIRGGTRAGRNLQVGSNCELQGSMEIGDYVRIQSGVHLGKGTSIGQFVWIFPNVLTVNDPLPPSKIHLSHRLEDMCCIAANTLLMPGVRIGRGSFVAAGSVVRSDVADGDCVTGNPAERFSSIDKLVSMEHRIAHPWPRHFERGYPTDVLDRAKKMAEEIINELRMNRKMSKS